MSGDAATIPKGSEGTAAGDPASTGVWAERSARLALVAFVAYLAVAFVVLMRMGEGRWFMGDEWALIIDRQLDDPASLVRPHNTHWVTVPTVFYHLVIKVVGLRHYEVFVGALVLLHLTLAGMLRIVMRRAGVGPWVASIAAGTFVMFGAGGENILQPMQITLVASAVAGIVHLLLADHDGALDRRDALGVGAGVVGLMASGIGLLMVAVVGIAVAVRRGWRMALVHTLPPATLFGLWWLAERDLISEQGTTELAPTTALAFLTSGLSGVFVGIAQNRITAVALAVVLVSGLVLAWRPLPAAELRRRAAVPVALLAGAVLVIVTISMSRQRAALGSDIIRSARYMGLVAAFLLPSLAIAITALMGRWKIVGIGALLILVAGVPANINLLDRTESGAAIHEEQRRLAMGVAYSPLAEEVPRDVQPDSHLLRLRSVTVGFLLDKRSKGQLSGPPSLTAEQQDTIALRLSLSQSFGPVPRPCRSLTAPIVIDANEGDLFGLGGPVLVREVRDGAVGTAVPYGEIAWAGRRLRVNVPTLRFRVEPDEGVRQFSWCGPTS